MSFQNRSPGFIVLFSCKSFEFLLIQINWKNSHSIHQNINTYIICPKILLRKNLVRINTSYLTHNSTPTDLLNWSVLTASWVMNSRDVSFLCLLNHLSPTLIFACIFRFGSSYLIIERSSLFLSISSVSSISLMVWIYLCSTFIRVKSSVLLVL